MSDEANTNPPAETAPAKQPADGLVIGLGIAEVTHLVATSLVQQGLLTQEAFANTTGATIGKVEHSTGTIEIFLFGKAEYKDDAVKVVE